MDCLPGMLWLMSRMKEIEMHFTDADSNWNADADGEKAGFKGERGNLDPLHREKCVLM